MKNLTKKGFTLVELLVVITIIAILWVVAYTSFGWATDKAKSAAKMQEVSSISSSLSQYKNANNFYPQPAAKDSTKNIWWFDSSVNASKTNTVTITTDADWKITNISWWAGWWKVNDSAWTQIWAKWTLAYSWNIKKYLKKDAYDHQIWDLEYNGWKLIDMWIWRFPYAVYKQWISWNSKWTEYNLAYTIKNKQGVSVTKIVWDFNEASCSWCPFSLIWSWNDVLKNWDKAPNVPYKIDF